MQPKIGLIGVPLEDIPVMDDAYPGLIPTYIYGITDEARSQIKQRLKQLDVNIQDLGEAYVGEKYSIKKGFDPLDRKYGIEWWLEKNFKERNISDIEKSRLEVLKSAKEFDLFVAIGPSHLGAIFLYDENDIVSRLDYHTDYTDMEYKKLVINHATYTNWVKHKITNIEVSNFFGRYAPKEEYFGKKATIPLNKSNHFDIDIDCFRKEYEMQIPLIYEDIMGEPLATTDFVHDMMQKAKPQKIGFWEYRYEFDRKKKGLDFMVDAILAAIDRK
jgi:hypothetical protein